MIRVRKAAERGHFNHGWLLTSGFSGGVICIHMSHQENFIGPSVLLAVTWTGAFLRGSVPLLAVKPADLLTRTSA